VDKVSKADIRRVANKVFAESNRTEAWTETAGTAQEPAATPAGGKAGAQ
jgi:hypothetical protein